MSRRETQVYSLSGSHWPQGWHYNHTIYGYGPGRYDTGVMCEGCWQERQRPDWGMQLPLVGM
ncbi:MAG: hypothetical protein ACM3US_07350 [Sphingomonadaceae bacterium]